MNDDGEVEMEWTGKSASFMFFITTFFILPPMVTLFILVEFKLSDFVNKHFKFLELQLGKGVFLLLMMCIFLEKVSAVEVVLAISISPLVLFDIAYGIYEIVKLNKPETDLEST